ncbi:hypothetical protein [aff. Roholtiella sp. LEGE 12411]|uniref:hypothetical protein n=1 Tax=aff. Roholtiella sp. LEGE 12411 TaxID=1828822 RepID=UPI001880DFBA|nr:hypothetical protein [aff. Roholtiella sp. LEGE 12411]MBE9035664.1 hypothetical protein [aff. Roholtiella sp. LEGE 12411]
MNRTIYIGLMALPVYLYNVCSSFASTDVPIFNYKVPITTALIAVSTNAKLHIVPWQISARDDQTEDCLRAGICKD